MQIWTGGGIQPIYILQMTTFQCCSKQQNSFQSYSTTIIWLCWSNNVSTTLTRSKLALGTFLKSTWIWENSTDDVRNPMTKDLSSLCSAILKMISARCELLPFLSQFLHIFANFLFDILQRCNATFDKY